MSTWIYLHIQIFTYAWTQRYLFSAIIQHCHIYFVAWVVSTLVIGNSLNRLLGPFDILQVLFLRTFLNFGKMLQVYIVCICFSTTGSHSSRTLPSFLVLPQPQWCCREQRVNGPFMFRQHDAGINIHIWQRSRWLVLDIGSYELTQMADTRWLGKPKVNSDGCKDFWQNAIFAWILYKDSLEARGQFICLGLCKSACVFVDLFSLPPPGLCSALYDPMCPGMCLLETACLLPCVLASPVLSKLWLIFAWDIM